MSASDKKDVSDQFSTEDYERLDQIHQAALKGGLVLIKCTRRADNERVDCLGILEQLKEGGHQISIHAVLVYGDAAKQFGPPFHVVGREDELAKLGVKKPGE